MRSKAFICISIYSFLLSSIKMIWGPVFKSSYLEMAQPLTWDVIIILGWLCIITKHERSSSRLEKVVVLPLRRLFFRHSAVTRGSPEYRPSAARGPPEYRSESFRRADYLTPPRIGMRTVACESPPTALHFFWPALVFWNTSCIRIYIFYIYTPIYIYIRIRWELKFAAK